MKKYLATGTMVQAFIIMLRWGLGKSREAIKENISNVYFWILLPIECMINIVLWPLSIVAEIYATVKGI